MKDLEKHLLRVAMVILIIFQNLAGAFGWRRLNIGLGIAILNEL